MTPNQTDLFYLTSESNNIKSQKLMTAIDNINKRFPKGITVSTTGFKNSWQYQVQHLSKRYTTSWSELAVVKCI